MPSRSLCSVLEEMRKCNETRNYSYMLGLIEEVQTMANRMEAALWEQKDFTRMSEKISRLKKEIKELEAKKEQLDGEKPKRSALEDF